MPDLTMMSNQEALQPVQPKPRLFYGYIIVICIFFIQLVMVGSMASYGVYFKPILNDFGWSRALISGAYSFSLIVRGFTGIIMGILNDRFGPRVVVTLCGVLTGTGYIIMSQINAPWHLYLIYSVIIGCGMGGLIVPQLSTVARWFAKRRSFITGIVIAGGSIGGVITPPVVNWLIFSNGWRNALIIMGAAVLLIIIIASQFLRRDPAQMGQSPYGAEKIQDNAIDSSMEGFSLKGATRTRQFWMMLVTFFCFGFTVMTLMLHIVPHVTDLEISAATAANILSVLLAASVTGSIIFGLIAQNIGNQRALIICFVLLSTVYFWILIAREVWMFYLLVICAGLPAGGLTTLQSPLVADLFGLRSHGLILGIFNFSFSVAAAGGALVAGYIFDVTNSYNLAFIICATASVLGLILSIMLRAIRMSGVNN